MDNPLDAVAVRVLGCMVEKEKTTPDNYPLTIKSLTAACNQLTNREPVMSLDDATVSRTVDELSKRSLVREVRRSDSRARRFRHTMAEAFKLHDAELAALSVLMLRGPQTTGEIRTRSARLFEFRDLPHVEVTLQGLMTLSTPLVVQLPRQPGQKEVRYAHLLAGEPDLTRVSGELGASGESGPSGESGVEGLREEVGQLRAELAELKAAFDDFRRQFQ